MKKNLENAYPFLKGKVTWRAQRLGEKDFKEKFNKRKKQNKTEERKSANQDRKRDGQKKRGKRANDQKV